MRPSQYYLFVCGTPRSGTTAMARTLSYHPDIVLGIERFKLRYSQGELDDDEFRSLFTKRRFLAFSCEDTNVSVDMAFARKFDLYTQEYDDAVYVGDKSPRLYERFQFLRRTFLACRVVFMLRDPFHVARSWQVRAMNPDDQWGRTNDYRAAVAEWNTSITRVVQSLDMFGDDLILVSYDDFFRLRPQATIATVFSLLHLDQGAEETDGWRRSMLAFLRKSTAIASSTREVSDALYDYVGRHADFETYQKLLRLAVAH